MPMFPATSVSAATWGGTDIKSLINNVRIGENLVPTDVTSIADDKRRFSPGVPDETIDIGGYGSHGAQEMYDLFFEAANTPKVLEITVEGDTYTETMIIGTRERTRDNTNYSFTVQFKPGVV